MCGGLPPRSRLKGLDGTDHSVTPMRRSSGSDRMRFLNVADVVRWRLCLGCGACAAACEKDNVILEDILDQGIRPVVRRASCNACGRCLEVCPGLGFGHEPTETTDALIAGLRMDWGPILEIWEGYSTDADIRYHGSSGGAATAIALHCLESGIAGGVYHIGNAAEQPWRNRTVLSRDREKLLSRAGSRYSPASPCECLLEMASAATPSVFIGKPCDVQGLRKAQGVLSGLRDKIGVALGIFCAGTPATAGIMSLLARFGLEREDVKDIRFRGKGWPGSFCIQRRGHDHVSCRLSYTESWGLLQAYRPFRCHLCPDGTGELADISCGDPWHRGPAGDDPGRSLILVRTERGRDVLRTAAEAGLVYLEPVEPAVLELSQVNLLLKRRAIWGRLIAMKAFGVPVPRYHGFPLFENWLKLQWAERARSVLGTVRRIVARKYYRGAELV